MTINPRSLIECSECGAAWEGIEGNCYWCDKRYEYKRDAQRTRLLFPEWMNWGDRFRDCSEINRTIWAQTRGFTGDYRGKWEDALFDAIENRVVTDVEADAAYGRYLKWMTRMQNSASV